VPQDGNRTALLEAPRRFRLEERAKPIAGPGEVVVRIAATAVCHTDLAMYTGHHPGLRYPVVMGHEATGVLESVGEGVAGLAPGRHVIINPIIACGRCDQCARGAENLCRNAGLFGREVEGSLSEFVRLPSRYVHSLPGQIPLASATLIETLATVRRAQQRAGIAAGESVVVLGQGATGLLHTRLAVLAGAHPVVGISRSPWKLDRAARMGAHHVIDASAEVAVLEALRLTLGRGADLVIDTVGDTTTLKAGVDMLRPGGRFLAFAVSHEPVIGFASFPLYYKELTIIGSRALTALDMEPSIELVASGQVDVSGFISSSYPLERTAAAFEEYERNPGRILRVVIESSAH
jgi:L-iditol 2-dehydrogenase